MWSDSRLATPVEIRKQGQERLRITWGDGHVSEYPAHYLRARCPCASCVDEITLERKVGPLQVVPYVELLKANLVGSYAVQIEWSDGHRTGIYSFDYLRSICGCETCARAKGPVS